MKAANCETSCSSFAGMWTVHQVDDAVRSVTTITFRTFTVLSSAARPFGNLILSHFWRDLAGVSLPLLLFYQLSQLCCTLLSHREILA